MKRLIPYIICTFLFVYVIIVLTFASAKFEEVLCRGVCITVMDAESNAFVHEEDVLRLVKERYGDVVGEKIVSINKDSLERVLAKNPMIESVQVYYSLDGFLHIDIKQREPVLRVFSGEGYYVDKYGEVMPLSSIFTSRVIVATGSINKEFACEKLFPLANFLKRDSFLNAYIEQIDVLPEGDVVLIPKVGDFKILLGTIDSFEKRLDKLELFLSHGIAERGWNKYKMINLKYNDQIVCVKK